MRPPLDLSISVPLPQALRYAGYPEGRPPERQTLASRRCLEAMDALWPRLVSMVRPRGAYRVIDHDEARLLGMPHPGPIVAAAACTIGGAIEELSARLAAEGRLLESLVADAFGSAAAEAAAAELQSVIVSRTHAPGLVPRPRVSPGYGDWTLANQESLLRCAGAGTLDMKLTADSMMIPRKSVSFAVSFTPGACGEPGPEPGCSCCPATRCAYRWKGCGGKGEDH